MRVIYFTHYTNLYGANKSLLELIKKMRENFNIEPIVVSPSYGEINVELDKLNIENYNFKYKLWVYPKNQRFYKVIIKYLDYVITNYCTLNKLKRLFKRKEIDLIHTNTSCIDIGCKLAKKLNIKHIWHIREFGEEDYGLGFYMGEKKAFRYIERYSEKVVLISNALKCKYSKYIKDNNKINVVYNGINRDIYYKKVNFDKKDKFNILCVGLITREKNQLELIKSINVLVNEKNINNINVFLLGDGDRKYIEELKQYCIDNGIEDNVKFEGRVNNISKYIMESSVGIITSTKEAFGRVTVEYMLGGLAVIASNSGANVEIITNDKDGMIYELGNYEELSEKIKLLYDNKERLNKLASAGQKTAIDKFTSDINCKNIYKLYKNVLNN